MSTYSRPRVRGLTAFVLAVSCCVGLWLPVPWIDGADEPQETATSIDVVQRSPKNRPAATIVDGAAPRPVLSQVFEPTTSVSAPPLAVADEVRGVVTVDPSRARSAQRFAGVVPEPTVAVPVPTSEPAATEAEAEESAQSDALGRGSTVLRQIGFDPAAIGYVVTFAGPRTALRGLTFTREHHIEVYVRPSMSDTDLAYVIAHELGHAVDHKRNTSVDRASWRAARGMAADQPWWPDSMGSDMATPAGDFAECFASWLVGSASHSAWGDCAPVAGLMAELAAR